MPTSVQVPALSGGSAIAPLFSNRLRFLEVPPSSVWLSIFGGIPVAYEFVTCSPNSPRVRKLSLRQWA